MLIDYQNLYGQDQAVTATAASTNVIDHGQTNPNLGAGSEGMLWLVILCTAAAASAGATTVDFAFQDSADNSSFSTLFSVSGVAKATLVAGYVVAIIPMPVTVRRYTRVYYTVNTANLTSGTFTAFLTATPQAWLSYARGYTITGA